MFDITKIGDSIHVHRKRAGLTQRKLGELARIGCSNISAYENGKIPCLYNAIAIADALQVSLDDLIGRVVMDRPTLTPPNEPLISGFDVIDTKTGEYPDLWEIALKEDWANGLMYCDMEGFAIEEDGTLLLLDECGKHAYCPEGRFKIVPRPPKG